MSWMSYRRLFRDINRKSIKERSLDVQNIIVFIRLLWINYEHPLYIQLETSIGRSLRILSVKYSGSKSQLFYVDTSVFDVCRSTYKFNRTFYTRNLFLGTYYAYEASHINCDPLFHFCSEPDTYYLLIQSEISTFLWKVYSKFSVIFLKNETKKNKSYVVTLSEYIWNGIFYYIGVSRLQLISAHFRGNFPPVILVSHRCWCLLICCTFILRGSLCWITSLCSIDELFSDK